MEGWYAAASERRPSPGEFSGLSIDAVVKSRDTSVVWLLFNERNSKWKPDMTDSKPTAGMVDMVVELLDINASRVIAVQRFPETSAYRVGNSSDLIATYHRTDDVFGEYRIRQLRLVKP
jgi:hypothetical protein